MISSWQSILALIVFLLTTFVGVFPFRIWVPLPTSLEALVARAIVHLRVCLPSTECCALHPVLKKDSVCTQAGGSPVNANSTAACAPAHPRQTVRERSLKMRRCSVPVNFVTAPPAAVLLLLAAGVLRGEDVREGIVGVGGVQPISIMALFLSLAYLSISLDQTGLFRYLAFWVARKGGRSGRRLYFYLYLFFFVCGVAVGNDPVVLFGTPFLAYFSHVSGIVPPTAWIFAQFAMANIGSAVLPPSNLTNLVLTGSFGITFISYPAYTFFPALAAAAAAYPLLAFYLFASGNQIPREIDAAALGVAPGDPETAVRAPGEEGHAEGNDGLFTNVPRVPYALTDKIGAIFGSVLLAATLIVLVGTSPLKIPVWEITVPPAVLMFLRDIWHDRSRWKSIEEVRRIETSLGDVELENLPALESSRTNPTTGRPAEKWRTMYSALQHFKENTLPTVSSIIPRLPFSLVLFAFCMFILVQALTTRGWVEVFATWWTAWIHVCSKAGTGSAVVGAIGGMLLISILLCNVCGTNIGATILLARVLQVWIDSADGGVPSMVRHGAIYALALGTNFGAVSFSFAASLAGLLWRDILEQKGIRVRQRQFALLNAPVVGVAATAAAAVLVAEMYVAGK